MVSVEQIWKTSHMVRSSRINYPWSRIETTWKTLGALLVCARETLGIPNRELDFSSFRRWFIYSLLKGLDSDSLTVALTLGFERLLLSPGLLLCQFAGFPWIFQQFLECGAVCYNNRIRPVAFLQALAENWLLYWQNLQQHWEQNFQQFHY